MSNVRNQMGCAMTWLNGPDGPYLTAVRKFIGDDMAALPKIKSGFAVLDVTAGRKRLSKRMPPGSRSLPDAEMIPVVIRGHITHQHGDDDGVSIEFGISVEEVEMMEPYGMATKSIGRATVKTSPAGKATLTVPDTTPAHFKTAKRNKADRKEKAWRRTTSAKSAAGKEPATSVSTKAPGTSSASRTAKGREASRQS